MNKPLECVLRKSAAGETLHCAAVQVLNRSYVVKYFAEGWQVELRRISDQLGEAESALPQLSWSPVVAARSFDSLSALVATTDADSAGSVLEHVA